MNPPDIASDTLVEAIARALCVVGDDPQTYWRDYTEEAQAALTAITEAGYAVVPVEPTEAMTALGGNTIDCADSIDAAIIYRAMINAAQAIEARSGETEGLDPQGESAVGVTDAPDHIMPPIRDSGPLESEEGE